MRHRLFSVSFPSPRSRIELTSHLPDFFNISVGDLGPFVVVLIEPGEIVCQNGEKAPIEAKNASFILVAEPPSPPSGPARPFLAKDVPIVISSHSPQMAHSQLHSRLYPPTSSDNPVLVRTAPYHPRGYCLPW